MTDNAAWRKSSYSGGSGGDCVEVASWRKSSYSGGQPGSCVEVADAASVTRKSPVWMPMRSATTVVGRSGYVPANRRYRSVASSRRSPPT